MELRDRSSERSLEYSKKITGNENVMLVAIADLQLEDFTRL